MRAMPSPQESTMPVSRTSSCFSYPLICSRMMSLISAARICIARFPPGLGFARGHLLRQARQLRPHAAIVNGPPDIEHDAAEKIRIDLGRGEDLAPAGQPPRQL